MSYSLPGSSLQPNLRAGLERFSRPRLALPALLGTLILSAAPGVQAGLITTTSSADITAFQSGATVQTFDSISGVTAFPLSDYNPHDLTGTGATFNKDATQSAFYNSGGASFNDPVGNPGVPIGVAAPEGGIAADKYSGNNVAGPLGMGAPILFDPGAFMEVIFPTGVSKVGVYVAHGDIQVILKDENNSNLATGDFMGTASAGEFIGFTRTSPDVRGVTILGTGAFTIDDFTFGATTTTTVPDSGGIMNLALAGGGLWLARRKWSRG